MADNVNHPAHYANGKIEVRDFVEDKLKSAELTPLDGYYFSRVVEYVSRCRLKDSTIEDLKKAQNNLNRWIEIVAVEFAEGRQNDAGRFCPSGAFGGHRCSHDCEPGVACRRTTIAEGGR